MQVFTVAQFFYSSLPKSLHYNKGKSDCVNSHASFKGF